MRQTEPAFLIENRFRDSLQHPLPYMDKEPLTRGLCRFMRLLSRRYVVELNGLEAIAPHLDPFILVLNHNQKLESILIPSLLIYHRMGKLIHFMADWNFLMMPFVASLYRRSQVIVVTRKSAKPKVLNLFKPLFKQAGTSFERALARLTQGASVGIFPEGTINRDSIRLMRGHPGAAKLALLAQVPVVPAGIRFPHLEAGQIIRDGAKMAIEIGKPLVPPPLERQADGPNKTECAAFHEQIMSALSMLCGKEWTPKASRRKKYVS